MDKMASSSLLIRVYTFGEKVKMHALSRNMPSTRHMEQEETRKDWSYLVTLKVTSATTECMFT